MNTIASRGNHRVYGSTYNRGRNVVSGRSVIGYRLSCSTCAWTARVNGPKSDAEPVARRHLRNAH